MGSHTGKWPAQDQALTRGGLKIRGWTDGLIRQFLPEPDHTRINPHYRSGPPVKFYDLARVEAIEATAEFRTAFESLRNRKAGAARAVETKRPWMRRHLDTVTIVVPKFGHDELIRRACNSYRDKKLDRRDYDSCASPDSDPVFLARIAVNYLRHELTSYEHELQRIASKVGARDAYVEIKEKVLEAIAETYPSLAVECERQISNL